MQNNNKKIRRSSSEISSAGGQGKKSGRNKSKDKMTPIFRRPIICPPDRAGMDLKVRVVGYISRALVIFFSVYGLVFFTVDALRLEMQNIEVRASFIALVCFVSVALFSVMRLSKYGAAGGAAVILGAAAFFAVRTGDIGLYASRMLITAKNVALTRLYNLGYYALSNYMTDISYTSKYSDEYYFKGAVAFFAILISLGFVLSALRRVRVLFPAIVSTVILGVIFTYNISRSNWGVVFIIAGFAGLLVMSAYDRLFADKPDKDRYDTETLLFEEPGRPEPPTGILTERELRRHRREERIRRRALKAELKREDRQMNVDEELSEYFEKSSAKKSKKGRVLKAKKGSTPEEKAARAAEKAQRTQEAKTAAEWFGYERRVRDSKTAQGGFAAIAAFAVAFVMLLLPALTVSESFSTIEIIDRRMEYYREYVTALLMGDDPILDELGYQNDKDNFTPRSTDAEHLKYTGAKVFTVETMSGTNVYLRGWIGVDYEDGAWHAASDKQQKAYRSLYNTYLDPTGSMFNYFYTFMNPSLIEDKDFSSKITSAANYGIIAMQVNIARVETGNSLVYMPSFLRVDDDMRGARESARGLYEYGTNQPKEDVTFVNYFDGIYTGRKFMKEIRYAAVSYVATMKNSGWYKNVAENIADYNRGYYDAITEIAKYAARRESGKNASLDAAVKAIFADAPENLISVEINPAASTKTIRVQYDGAVGAYVYNTETGELVSRFAEDVVPDSYIDPATGELVTYTRAFIPPPLSLYIRYRELMSDQQRRELAYAYYYQYMYTKFVYGTYLDKADSAVIKNVLKDIIGSATESVAVEPDVNDPDGLTTYIKVQKDLSRAAQANSTDGEVYEQRHELVMEIVNYFKENMEYTITPSKAVDPALDGVENFLAVTKEGYCVQYASALALLLREAGIPARYVDGYVACDFRRNYSGDAAGRYITTVRDHHAHAWVEVWYDGVGWVQYEATPVYYSDMYEKITGEGGGGVVRPWDPADEMTAAEEMLSSLLGAIDFADARIELMSDDIALLAGNSSIKKALDNISGLVSDYRGVWRKKNDYYTQNRDGVSFNADVFMDDLLKIQSGFDSDVGDALSYQQTRVDSLRATNRAIWLSALAVLLFAALIIVAAAVRIAALKAEKKRAVELERVIGGDFTDGDKRELARRIIDRMALLFDMYGTPPRKGEFRDEYADRLTADYIDIFGRKSSTSVERVDEQAGLVSDIDFHALLESVFAEEFGFGMSREELMHLGEFVKRLQSAADKRLSTISRFVFRYLKRQI